jgi:hypothetical protein
LHPETLIVLRKALCGQMHPPVVRSVELLKLIDWSRKGMGSQRSIIFIEIDFGRSQGWAWEAIEWGHFRMQQRN